MSDSGASNGGASNGEFVPVYTGLRGRPSKKTPELVGKLLYTYARGLSFRNACSAVGIDHQTGLNWREDPEFEEALEQARNERKVYLLGRLEADPTGWQRFAWLAERLAPQEFSKPEVQLQLNTQVNVVNVTQSNVLSANADALRQLLNAPALIDNLEGLPDTSNADDPNGWLP